jgi:hypothetical protein
VLYGLRKTTKSLSRQVKVRTGTSRYETGVLTTQLLRPASVMVGLFSMTSWNGCGRNRLWSIFKAASYSVIWLERMRKPTKNLSQYYSTVNYSSDHPIRSYVLKTKIDPATRHGGAWGERRCSSYSFLTSALDEGEWSASRPCRALPPGKGPRYPLYRRLGGPQSRSGRRGGDRTPVVQSVVRHYTDWGTPAAMFCIQFNKHFVDTHFPLIILQSD